VNPQVEAAFVAGVVSLISLGGTVVVAAIGFRTTKSVTGSTLAEQRARTLNERFATAADKLGSDKPPAVRLAGVYAMAGLADDWPENRQTCVDVLCAYLRIPYEPDPGGGSPLPQRLAFRASREVRHTVIRVINAHLTDGAAVSWRGLNFDFTGVVFDGGSFARAEFSGGTVDFSGAEFSGTPPATAASANQMTLSLTGDKNCLAVTCTASARESLPINCALPNRVPPLKVLLGAGALSEQNSFEWWRHNSAASQDPAISSRADVGRAGGRRRARHGYCHPGGELRGQPQRV